MVREGEVPPFPKLQNELGTSLDCRLADLATQAGQSRVFFRFLLGHIRHNLYLREAFF
jgi:hypothetical protein